MARRREQLSDQLQRSFIREQEAQEQRIAAENAKAQADQQPTLVAAEIDLEAPERRKQARENDGEGEKKFLIQVAEGQRAQAEVLRADRVLLLQALEAVLKTLTENPSIADIVPDPQSSSSVVALPKTPRPSVSAFWPTGSEACSRRSRQGNDRSFGHRRRVPDRLLAARSGGRPSFSHTHLGNRCTSVQVAGLLVSPGCGGGQGIAMAAQRRTVTSEALVVKRR